MKTGLVTAVKNEVAKSISPKKAEKAASVAVKDGKEMIAAGQDALAAQGKSMVKPYEKPEMTVVEIKRQDLKAASGTGNGWNTGGRDDDGTTDLNSDWSDVKGHSSMDWGDVW